MDYGRADASAEGRGTSVYQAVFEICRVPMVLISVDETILNVNSAFLECFGVERSAVTGEPFSVLVDDVEHMCVTTDAGYLGLINQIDSIDHFLHVRHHISGELVLCRMGMTLIRDVTTGFSLYCLFEFQPVQMLQKYLSPRFFSEHHRFHASSFRPIPDPRTLVAKYQTIPSRFSLDDLHKRPCPVDLYNTLQLLVGSNPRPIMYLSADPSCKIMWANKAACAFLAIDPLSHVGLSFASVPVLHNTEIVQQILQHSRDRVPEFVILSRPLSRYSGVNVQGGGAASDKRTFRLWVSCLRFHIAEDTSRELFYTYLKVVPVHYWKTQLSSRFHALRHHSTHTASSNETQPSSSLGSSSHGAGASSHSVTDHGSNSPSFDYYAGTPLSDAYSDDDDRPAVDVGPLEVSDILWREYQIWEGLANSQTSPSSAERRY
eukprot:ANDGO_00395.mRNA.1 hypothetical protein